MNNTIKTVSIVAALAVSSLLSAGCDSAGDQAASVSSTQKAAADAPSADGKGFYANVNNVRLFYTVQGTGDPIILLHGGLVAADSTFAAYVPELAKTRKVITVDLQAHGHTPDADRPMRFESMADDIAGLITHLNLGKADVFGYSLGGGVALQLSARHPDAVNRLIVTSATFRSDGWSAESRAGMAAMDPVAMQATPLHEMYVQAAPDPAGWTALVTKTRQLLGENYDWTTDLAAVKARALVINAENDAVLRPHSEDLAARISKTALQIVPGTTHYDLMYRPDLLLPLINGFLDTPSPR